MCAANPDSPDRFVEGTDTVFNSITMPALKKSGTAILNQEAVRHLNQAFELSNNTDPIK